MRIKAISLVAAVVFLLAGAAAYAAGPDESSLIGVWKGAHGKDELVFEFMKDGVFTLSGEGNKMSGTYKVDFSTKPISLDLTMKMGEELSTRLTIIEFLNENQIRIEEPSKTRPTGFNKDPVVFIRQGAKSGGKVEGQEFKAKPLSETSN